LILLSTPLTLNQRVQGSSPCAPTNVFNSSNKGQVMAPLVG
jgi:hypothetical protein